VNISSKQSHTWLKEMIDPICDMPVEGHRRRKFDYDGETYYFCSVHCQKLFQTDPAKYLAASIARRGAQATPQALHPQHHPAVAVKPEIPGAIYTCPMDPEVRQQGAGACPKCGMALEPLDIAAASTKTEYTCPMHPEVVREEPGSCPICGMALEARTVSLTEEKNPELEDMTRRFWVGVVLSIPVLLVAMSDMLPGQPLHQLLSSKLLTWLQFLLASPVVLWCGWPFIQRAWASILNRSPNMFTLIGIGVGTAYVYSVTATLLPDLFPDSPRPRRRSRRLFRGGGGDYDTGFARPGAGAARAQQNQRRDPGAARPRAQDRAPSRSERRRTGYSVGPGASR
jgi:Cu+-exporting ATPase